MGDDREEASPADGEGPVREVTLSPYQIDATAVSNSQLAEFTTATGHLTDAERHGWSFVFVNFLGGEATRHALDGHVPDTRGGCRYVAPAGALR